VSIRVNVNVNVNVNTTGGSGVACIRSKSNQVGGEWERNVLSNHDVNTVTVCKLQGSAGEPVT